MSNDATIPAVYNILTGNIGCVLLQAGCGGDSAVSQLFDTQEWDLAPSEGHQLMRATASQWRQLADMPREERVRRFNQTQTTKP